MKKQRGGEEIKHFKISPGKCECDAVNWEKESDENVKKSKLNYFSSRMRMIQI